MRGGLDGGGVGLKHVAVAALACAGLSLALPVCAQQADELIWPRIVARMRLVDDDNAETRRWARDYARHPDAVRQLLARAEPYLWHIVEAVERRDMPAEIVLLPAIESGFDPAARSQQHASGLWQFVPWTGREMGLHSTRDYDGRRDPVASTRAALGHLSDLHERFGDWHLALAAYNTGAARLAGLMRKQPQAADFWALKLPREPHEHVRRLMGLALLVEQPQKYGLRLPPIANRPANELVALRKPIDLDAAARKAQVREAVVRAYNPGLHNLGNTTGKKYVVLPAADAARLRRVLAAGEFPPQPIPQVLVHVVQPGESLWRIARRYAVSVETIVRWNRIADRTVIRPGRRLEVPIRV